MELPQEATNQLTACLSHWNLSDIDEINNQKLLSISSATNLHAAFDEMVKNKVLCVPVHDEKWQWLGLLDMKDFVFYLLNLFGMYKSEKKSQETTAATVAYESCDLVNFSRKNEFVPIADHTPMLEVIAQLCLRGLYRMPVIKNDKPEEVVAMISQMGVLQFLLKKKDELGRHVRKSVADLRVGGIGKTAPLVSAKPTTTLLVVYQLLYQNSIHGCAIVDDDGLLIGNISVTDLQYNINDNLGYLALPVSDFLKEMPRKKPVTCHKEDSLIDIVKKMAEDEVHRVYVTDDKGVAISVITATDVLESILALTVGETAW